jgi:predicted DNA-binding transcriptional regulator YafY
LYRRGDVGQVARALKILDALRGFKQGRFISELAREVGASERTVKRDIGELQDAGIDIARLTIDGRAAARLKDRAYSYIAITRRERYTLLAVRRVFDVLQGTSFAEDIESVLRKLEQRMTPEERAEHATFGERFAYRPDGGTKQYTGKDDILDALLSGVLSRKLVRYAYRGARGRAQRGFLAPFAMLLYKHGLYVLGKRVASPADEEALASGDVINWAVERFSEVEWLRDASFAPPADFKLDDFIDDSFGVHVSKGPPQHVVIEFSKERATYARGRVWHRTQVVEEQRDGTMRLSFTCRNLAPVVSWVLGWGPHARVIEPPELVDMIVDDLDGARGHYPARKVRA